LALISLNRTVQNAFRYLEPFRRDSRVWRTDGRTDRR